MTLQSLLWQLLWLILKILLDISKDFIVTTIEAVKEAENLKNADGSSYTGAQKKDYVFNKLAECWDKQEWVDKGQRITNVIIEVAVSYLKSLKKDQ